MDREEFELLNKRLKEEGRNYFILISPPKNKKEEILFALNEDNSWKMRELFLNLFQTANQQDIEDFFIKLMIEVSFDKLITRMKIMEARKTGKIN